MFSNPVRGLEELQRVFNLFYLVQQRLKLRSCIAASLVICEGG